MIHLGRHFVITSPLQLYTGRPTEPPGPHDLAIAFNPAYLMDPLKALEDDEIFFELIDELSPGVVKINGPFLYVIMPMRMS